MHVPDPDQFSTFSKWKFHHCLLAIVHQVGLSGEEEQLRSTFSASVLSSSPWSFCNEIHIVLAR